MELEPRTNGTAPTTTKTTYTPLVKADANAVRRLWPRVRLGCLAIKAADKQGNAGNWTVEHLRAQLEMGFQGRSTCELWLIQDRRGQTVGFIITIFGNCPYLNVPQSLITWVAYTFTPVVTFGRSGVLLGRAILAQLEQYTRDCGLRFHDGYSDNIQWLKWLERCGKGYRVAQMLFRKDVWRD